MNMISLWDYFCLDRKFLVFNLVSRNLKVKYRRSFLGTFWTLLAPLSLAATYYFVFGRILHVQLPHYLAHIVVGVLAWNLLAGTLTESLDTLLLNQPLISKIPVPIQIFPWVATVTNVVTFLLAMPVIAGVFLFSGVKVGLPFLFAPLALLALFLVVYALSLISSIAYVYFRDLKHALTIGLQLWLYGTPVFYNRSLIPEHLQWILYANPIAALWSCLQDLTIHNAFPPWELAATAGIWTGALLAMSLFILHAFGRRVAEDL